MVRRQRLSVLWEADLVVRAVSRWLQHLPDVPESQRQLQRGLGLGVPASERGGTVLWVGLFSNRPLLTPFVVAGRIALRFRPPVGART